MEELELSNFDGQDIETLMGDDEVNFAGNHLQQGFNPNWNGERVFHLTLANANAAVRYAYISHGLVSVIGSESNGQIKTGTFNDKNGDAGLSGSSSGHGTIEQFMAYIQKKPIRVLGIKIASDDATQLAQILTFERQDPFQSQKSFNLDLNQYRSEMNENDKFLSVPYPFQMDEETRIEFPVPGNATTTLIFYCGVSLDRAKKLHKLQEKANDVINVHGVGRVTAAMDAIQAKRNRVNTSPGRLRLGR